jgi:hypothetical protein
MRRLLLSLVVLVAGVVSSAPSITSPDSASANGVLSFDGPVTDNYKTWQPRTGTDNRTSLLFTGVTVGGQTYVVSDTTRATYGTSLGAPTEWHAAGGIPLSTSADGPTVARLGFDHDGGNAYSYFRLWPDGTFGPLMTIDRPAFVANPNAAVQGTFTLRSTGGTVLGTRVVNYRYDAGVAALPETSGEWNGPLGRWYVGADTSAPTPLNWPAGIAISGQQSGAHQASVTVEPDVASTVYVAPVDIAGLPIPRGDTPVSLAWTPAGAGRPTSVGGSGAWRPVTVTVPEGTYSVQATGSCATACRYDFASQALTPATSTIEAAAAPEPEYQPDAAVRAAGGTWLGDGVVNSTGTGQSVTAAIPLGSSRDFEVRVTNGGNVTDTFGLADARAGTHTAFEYTWRYEGTDVTTQVHDDGWFLLNDVPVGAIRTLQLSVRAAGSVGATATYGLHSYHSPASAGIKDVVTFQLTVAEADPGTDGNYVRPAGAPEVPIQACSRWASPTGDDDNPGTQASPVLSLSRLTAVLAPGQTGCLEDNSTIVTPYQSYLGVMSGGAPGLPKIIRPETPGERATVISPDKFLVNYPQTDLIIMDIDFRGSETVGGGNLVQINGDRVMLDGVDISWPRNVCLGVGADNFVAEDFVLIDSRIHGCGTTHVNNPNDVGGAHGAYLQYVRDGADADDWGAIVYNSLFDHNDARGVQLYPDADDVLVDQVVMYRNGSNLNVGSLSPAVRSENNLISNSVMADSLLPFDDPVNPNPSSSDDVVGNFPGGGHNGANNVIADSCLSNTVRPGLLFAVTSNGNSLVRQNVTQNQPPTFVDVSARDFRLTTTSTCQGMGLTDISRLPLGMTTGQSQAPATPTGVSATPGDRRLTITWSAPSTDGGSAITSYTATATPGGATCGWTTGARTCTITGLTNGTSYSVRVTATNQAGTSSPSAAATATPRTVPGAPRQINVSPGNRRVGVRWDAPASNGGAAITGYTATTSPGGATCTSSATARACTISGLSNGTDYTVTVRATNVAGTGPAGTAATSVRPRRPPDAPTNVSVTPGRRSVQVTFSPPRSNGGSPITSYTARCTSSNGGTTGVRTLTRRTIIVTGLTPGKRYTCQVRATNAAGPGPYTAKSRVVTPRS